MNYRNNQFDMSHTLTSYFFLGYFYTTTVTNNTLITDTLILTAIAFVVFYWTEYFFAKQTITFWLISTIVNGFRL